MNDGDDTFRSIAQDVFLKTILHCPIPLGAIFQDAFLRFEVDPDDSKALFEPERPLKVVHQRPDKVSRQWHTCLHRAMRRRKM